MMGSGASPQQCPRDGCCLVPTRGITPPVGGSSGLQSHAGSPSLLDQRKSVPSCHIRWRITDSLRATATMAFFPPIFLASRVPQALIGDQRETRLKNDARRLKEVGPQKQIAAFRDPPAPVDLA